VHDSLHDVISSSMLGHCV